MEQRCHNVITWILEGENIGKKRITHHGSGRLNKLKRVYEIECIIQKTLGRGEKLPKPQEEQIEMGKLTLDAIAKWRDKYGHKYLQVGSNHAISQRRLYD